MKNEYINIKREGHRLEFSSDIDDTGLCDALTALEAYTSQRLGIPISELRLGIDEIREDKRIIDSDGNKHSLE